jgi:glycosyltransferase involved in cell wall biosynthesis
MRILFVCDGRSPIAMNWISYFLNRGDEVHIASTFYFSPEQDFASVRTIPVAFSQLKGKPGKEDSGSQRKGLLWKSSAVRFRTAARRILAPLTLGKGANQLSDLIEKIQPDIVHAMRIPFEGILAARSLRNRTNLPMIVSVWGNDFTLHAVSTPWMGRATREVLSRADGLHTDCQRDRKLAPSWGYQVTKPTLVVPGNGGIHTDLFHPPRNELHQRKPVVINPRGIRAYIRNDTFFAAIPRILDQIPGTRFICPGMSGDVQAEKWVKELGISSSVELLPGVTRSVLADLFQEAAVAVSPSTHDGTPNSLLEAMASGCYPVAGDLESIREWIEPGFNGSLIDPGNPDDLAREVVRALSREDLRSQAAQRNIQLIAERAEYERSMQQALDFYSLFID